MKTIKRRVKCGCCGKETEIWEIESLYVDDYSLEQCPKYQYQLDKIQECQWCQYCGWNIEQLIDDKSKEAINSKEYKEYFQNNSENREIQRIKAAISIEDEIKRKIQLYFNLCWYLEFENRLEEAKQVRETLVGLLEKELTEEPPFELILIYIECLRRLRRFLECQDIVNEIDSIVEQKIDCTDITYLVFKYEKELIEKNDSAKHMMSEIEV